MFFSISTALCFSIGFFFESIFGFGGGLIAYSILGFLVDVKNMVLAGLYIGTMSSLYIAISSHDHFDKKIFIKLLPISLMGSIAGVYIFQCFSAQILSVFFGFILLILSIRLIFFDKYKIPKIIKNKFLFFGAISQGAFGIGGPFIVSVINDDFKSKSALRATMAVYFVFCNILRIIQMSFSKILKIDFFMGILWTIIPVFIAIFFGHKIHLKISNKAFKNGLAIITLMASINFIFKAFYQ
ncbi:MAG: sulfite exporter TauE/SafE family protein [Alphaproteobacteria bacterium]|nr:sulfite exporter TauE/SafE family protein [Alphaproteobacteria bacterium]